MVRNPPSPEPRLPATVLAEDRDARDRFREALARRDDAAAADALRALAMVAARARFTRSTPVASVHAIVEELFGHDPFADAPHRAAVWSRRCERAYDEARPPATARSGPPAPPPGSA